MTTFTRRTLVRGGTALTATAALAGPALLEWASAWAQAAPWKPEAGAKLTVMRWKRFVEAEDQAFMAMVDAFKKTTGVDMNVFSESFSRKHRFPRIPARDRIWSGGCIPCRSSFPTRLSR